MKLSSGKHAQPGRQQSKQQMALLAAKEFLGHMARTRESILRPPRIAGQQPSVVTLPLNRIVAFSRGRRSFVLTEEHLEQYREILQQVYRALPSKRRVVLDFQTVGTYFNEAILDVLRPESAADDTTLIEIASATLAKQLASPEEEWRLYFRISGLEVRRRHRFGGLEFLPPTPATFRRLLRKVLPLVRRSASPRPTKTAVRKLYRDRLGEVTQSPLACVVVKAVDHKSAGHLGIQRVRLVLDVVAFCESLVMPRGLTGLPTVDGAEWQSTAAIVMQDGGTFSLPSEPYTRTTSLSAMLQRKQNARFIRQISALLEAEKPTPIELRVIGAMSWAGRAAGRARPEDQFLAYLVALESLLLDSETKNEVSYRIRHRCAWLIGRNRRGRVAVEKRVGELYSVRSAIVHNGSRNVLKADVADARYFVILGILELLTSRRFGRHTDFDEWLEERILG